jgi:2-keto-3-deoxy-L-rhamnonate aldolase RhmA
MNGREIIAALHEGRNVFSSAMISPSPLWPPLVKQTGIDFVFIDTEHIPIDRQTLAWMCQAYLGLGLPSVVRLPSCDPFEACKALDAGAGGVIGPYVETAEQVEGLVGAVKLKPLKGRRLAAALRDRKSLEPELAEYMERRNGDKILVVNIESVPAIENLSAICSVPGLDAILIGPHDLSCSLGIPERYDHPRFDEAVRTIFRVVRQHGIGAGTHSWPAMTVERAIELTRAGANLLMHSSDMSAFSKLIKAEIAELRLRLAT